MKRILQRRKSSKAVPRRSKLIEKPKRKPLRASAKRGPAPRLPSQRLAKRRRQATRSPCSATCSTRASNKLKQKPKVGKVGKKRLMQNWQATPKAKTIKKRSAKIRKTKPLLARRADAPGEAPPAEGARRASAGEPAEPRALRPAGAGGQRHKETKLERSRCFESAYSAICEYFVTEVNPSAFSKLLAFFNNELREPFFGLLLKKFYVKFQKSERFKDLHLLKNFFTRLKYCKGLMALEKVEEQQKPAAADDRNK